MNHPEIGHTSERTTAQRHVRAIVGKVGELWQRKLWSGTTDARPSALLRIALGVLLIDDLADRLRDFHAFYTRTGIVIPSPTPLGFPHVSLFHLASGPALAMALFAMGFTLAFALTVGWHTRWVSCLTWLFVTSLHNRNPYVCDGGDIVLRLMLFWGMWSQWGARFSIDARYRAAGRQKIPALPVRLMQLQVAYIYLATALSKNGVTWRDGTAIHRVLSTGDFARGLGPWLAGHPTLCMVLTYATLAIEFTVPVLVLIPWRRGFFTAVAILAALAFHLGIFLTMRIGVFSQIMPVSFLVFLRPAWLDRFFGTKPPRGARAHLPMNPLARVALSTIVVIVALQVALQPLEAKPLSLASTMALLGQSQQWPMFAPNVPRVFHSLSASGTNSDGGAVDVIAHIVPGLGPPRGFRHDRWRKVRDSLVAGNRPLRAAFGRYVCRRGRASGGASLRSFDLYVHIKPLDPPGPETVELSMKQVCTPPANLP